jgi:DNA-binding CsgD family transcriptional regulator/tetratricopeptide (TPR) repeat protein
MGGHMASPTFVGRIKELQTLEAARDRSASGEPAVVLLRGEAGVGKTRLIAELTTRGIANGVRLLQGGCVPVGNGGLAYAPIVQALRTLTPEFGVSTVRELIGPNWPELTPLLPALGRLASGPPGQAAQVRLFELLLGLLGRLSVETPMVLVVEDLHWADQSTRDLLAFLVRNLRRERMLLVASYRSDQAGRAWLGPYLAELDRGGPVQRLELPRLDRAQTTAQLTGILGAAPAADLVDDVFARSEGNPFFTEELLAALRAGSRELPSTVRDLLRGRVEALSERSRQVLGAIAVAGRQVPHRLLAAITGLDDQRLIQALREAVDHQLLLPGEDGYDFRHALLREVINADLLPGERTRLHAACAQALASWHERGKAASAGAAAELAIHWDAAGEPGRALPARVEAGLAAERARAFPEAARHYQRAVELWTLVPEPGRPAGLDQVTLLTRAAEAVSLAGTTKPAIELLEQALGLVDQAVEPVRAALLLSQLGEHHHSASGHAAALAAYDEAERLLAPTAPSPERAGVLAAHAHALLASGRPREAVSRCEEAIKVARLVGARTEEAQALNVLASCLDDPAEADRSIALHLDARRLAEKVGDAETVLDTYVALADTLRLAGRDRDALADAQEGYQRACQFGLERGLGSYVAYHLAWQLLAAGRWAECEQFIGEVVTVDSWDAPALHTIRGQLLARQGDFASARAQLDQARQLNRPDGRDPTWLVRADLALWERDQEAASAAVAEGLRWRAAWASNAGLTQHAGPWYALALRLAADQAERAAARRAADDVAEIRRRAAPVGAELDRLVSLEAPQARQPGVLCNLLLARAELSRLEGRSDPERWQAAAAAWERLERPFEAAYARFRQAEALLARGVSRPEAEQVLRRAHQTAAALGAAPLQREIQLLTQRGHLRLEQQVDTIAAPKASPSPATSFSLTRREAEVLRLVAEGRTNRQIGQELFITTKTASVHVSHILAKLGVAGRGEAAAIAHRLGLDRP